MPQAGLREHLEKGREAYAERAWDDAYASLADADRAAPLEPDDLELLATSASMTGRIDEYLTLLERIHHAHLDAGEGLRAARAAFWAGMTLATRGDLGPAGGWFARAQRLIEREGVDCVESGYLLVPQVYQQLAAGEYDAAMRRRVEPMRSASGSTTRRSWPPDSCFGVRPACSQGRAEQGLALLDEAMVAVTAPGIPPILTGVIYCGVIACCEDAFDPRRAQEWTTALTRWCERQPQMVSFTGRCLAHRAGIMQLHGAWDDALAEARLARERCEQAMNRSATGQALYQQAELHRLRGELAAAEAAYRDASRFGREPQPGLALLRLRQGDAEAAAAALRRVLVEPGGAAAACDAPSGVCRGHACRPATSPRRAGPPTSWGRSRRRAGAR